MSIRRFFYLFLLAGFVSFAGTAPAQAQEESDELVEDADSAKKKAKKKAGKGSKGAEAPAKSAVVAAFENFKVLNARLNQKAEYFIYFYTSSTCVHCVNCMQIAAEQYKKMKASRKVELVVICTDKTEADAKKYLKKSKIKAPCIMFDALKATQFKGLPGCGMPIPPAVSIVSKDGTLLQNELGGSAVQRALTDWRELTIGK